MKAVDNYNNIMFAICREYNTIGTSYTEDAEHRNNWNLRDMVSEMQYTLDIYRDPDCIYYEEAYDDCQPAGRPWYKQWKNITARMQRFINKYRSDALCMECTQCHCSIFD